MEFNIYTHPQWDDDVCSIGQINPLKGRLSSTSNQLIKVEWTLDVDCLYLRFQGAFGITAMLHLGIDYFQHAPADQAVVVIEELFAGYFVPHPEIVSEDPAPFVPIPTFRT